MEDLKVMSLEDIGEKYGLTLQELFNLSKQMYCDEGGKFISTSKNGNYMITKSINGVNVYFGSYTDYDEAVIVRDELIKNGWDMEMLPIILFENNIKSKCGNEVWRKK